MNNLKFLNTHDLLRHYSKNSTNNIEDPIFTGFTFAIDKQFSPLFFNGEEYITSETLRSPEGMDVQENEKDTPLAKRIEDKLKYINDVDIIGTPNGYDMSTIKAKDPFGSNNGRKPGYGLWDEHDIDKPLYGAVDYIYMVDKVVEGTYSKSDYIGNGTPNKSIYDTYAEELSAANIFFGRDEFEIRASEKATIAYIVKTLTDNPELQVTLSGYADKQTGTESHNLELSKNRAEAVRGELIGPGNDIDPSRITTAHYGDTVQPFAINVKNRAVICKFIGKLGKEEQKSLLDMNIQNAKTSITDEMNAANEAKKEALKTARENYMSVLKKYKALRDVEDLQNAIDEEKRNVKSDLSDFKSTIEKKLEILKTSSDNDIRSTTKSEVEKIWNDFKNMVGDISSNDKKNYGKNLEVEYKYPDEKTIENELNSIRKNSKINDSDEEILKNIIVMMKTNIHNVSVKDESVKDLNTKRENKKKLESELFGTGTEANPTAVKNEKGKLIGSLGYLYNKANEDYETDQVTSINNYIDLLNDTKENIDNTNAYTEKMSGSSSTQRTSNETIVTDTGSGETKKVMKEVPQTVYDMLGFIYGMKSITEDYPYVLQSITGLDEAYKKYFEMKDPYMGSGDNKITIDCLEFLDMRVSSMFNKYFNAVYDRHYRRERVPINLRRFNCSVFVHDIRNFRNSINVKDEDITNTIGDLSMITELALNYMSAVEFKFFDCEIVPEETGSIFENVTNLPSNEMRNTKFVFTYGNCVINFLPFDDLRQYVLKKNKDLSVLEPFHKEAYSRLTDVGNNEFDTSGGLDGNFRRWFDKSLLGNVNNNDYREYIRRDASVAVDDHYKTTIVNDFALGSVAEKNKELTRMNDALRRLVTGVAASTGVPTEGVADALNIGFIKPILNETDKAAPVAKNLGNVTNSKIIDTETTEYIGTTINEEQKEPRPVKDLGNVNEEKDGK